MSLINEALKKAQRQRGPEAGPADPTLPVGAPSGPILRRGRPLPAQTLLLIVAGSAVLIVFSAIITVYLMNRAPEPKSVPVTILPPPPVTAVSELGPSPVIVAPAVGPDRPSAVPPVAVVPPAPPAAAPISAPEPPPAPAPPDPRIQTFIDAIRVAGIRSFGNESKVLMNDRVYRVGDVVDMALGIKLETVSSDSLTFVDAHGATYKKYF